MKIPVLNINGEKIKEIETELFEEPIREDIIFKVVEAERMNNRAEHPYSTKLYAGMNRSASGNVRHKRHSWKSDRGRGLARIPKKAFWRRGTQFSWEGAIVPFARGGRRAHPPSGLYKIKKINKKELKKALLSALSYISNFEEIKKKYNSLSNFDKINNKLPLVVENKIFQLKTKEFFESLKRILGELYRIAIQKKTIRAGIGKMRGRKYKKNAGLLFIIGNDEDKKIKGIETIKVKKLMVNDLAENGARLVLFSENAIKDLEKLLTDSRDSMINKENKRIKKKKDNIIIKDHEKDFGDENKTKILEVVKND